MQKRTIMKTHRTVAPAVVLLLTLLLSGAGAVLPATVHAMQLNGNSYTTQSTGQTVAWTAPWSYDKDNSTTGAGSEVVFLDSDTALVLIGFLPNGIDMNQARDQLLTEFQKDAAGFKQLDRSSYANVSYSLDMATIKSSSGDTNTEFGVFTLFLGNTGKGATVVYLFMAPISVFTQGMNSAKSNITIDGAAIFDGVTPGGLQNLLDKNASASAKQSSPSTSTGSNTANSTAKQTTPEPQATATEGASGGPPAGGLHLGNGSSESSGTKGGNTPDQSGTSGKATNQYTDPQFGFSVDWSGGWTSEGVKAGSLFLTNKSKGGIATFSGIDSQGSTISAMSGLPEKWVESESLIQNAKLGDSQLSADRVTFVVTGDIQGTPMKEVLEVKECPDQSCFVVSRFIAPDSTFSGAVADFQRNVSVNGETALRDLDQVAGT